MPIRVLVADDQAMVRGGFLMILGAEDDVEVVGEADDGERAVAEAQRLRPEVVVMDIQMPNLDGVAATREILARVNPPPRVLIVTTFDIDEYVYEALRAGASGFLLKNSPPEDLVRAIRVVAAGEALLAPSVTRRLVEQFGGGSNGAQPSGAASASAPAGVTPNADQRSCRSARLSAASSARSLVSVQALRSASVGARRAARTAG